MLSVDVSRVILASVGQSKARLTALYRAICLGLVWSGALFAVPSGASASIAQRITATTITLPEPLEGATANFCTWGFCTGFGPRLYQAPMADGRTLIGWTDATGNGHVSRVNGASIEQTFDFAATPVRGLVVHPDNSFAVLLQDFNNANANIYTHFMELSLLSASGSPVWTTPVPNNLSNGFSILPGAVPNPQTFGGTGIGDSRLAYEGGTYYAYFSVVAEPDSTGTAHDGDQLALINDSGVIQPGGWPWGLSHSLAELIGYHPDLARMTEFGVSDCFPARGMYADESHLIFPDAANCGGNTAVQLGQMAAVTGGNWLVAFSGQSEAAFTDAFGTAQPAFSAQGIGVVSFNGTYVPSAVTWLTNTTGTDERDPVLARIGASLLSNRFLVGWRLQTEGTFNMEVINPAGSVLNPLEVVSPTAGWGNRDDSLKSRPDGSISWLQGAAGSTTLQLYRYFEIAPTRDFTGARTSDILWRDSDGQVVAWLMQGSAISSSTSLGAIPTSWNVAGSGDFNGDGTSDILWRNSTGDVVIWSMKAGNIATSGDLGVTPTSWSVVGTGDFNGDGTSDILWRNSDGQVVAWLMQGAAISSSMSLGTISASWSVAGTGDFNGDGTTDILWRNSNGDVVIWLMHGGAINSSNDLGVTPTSWSVVGTGDFNGDGKSDILWRNSDGQVVTWLMQGATISSSTSLGSIPLSWTVAGAGDFNGDGTTDILWRNSNGDVVIWPMQGGTISTSIDLGVTSTAWTIVP